MKTILAWREGPGSSDFRVHFPGQSVPDTLVWNLRPDPIGPYVCGRVSQCSFSSPQQLNPMTYLGT